MKLLKPTFSLIVAFVTVSITLASNKQGLIKKVVAGEGDCYSIVQVYDSEFWYEYDFPPPMLPFEFAREGLFTGGVITNPTEACIGSSRFCCATYLVLGDRTIVNGILNKD
jgi:hypothetical protein